jgi:hypothetical protein
MFRAMINTFFPSTFIFPDGSRVDYLIRDDCLRYRSPPPRRDSLEIPLKYDAIHKKSRINTAVDWRWQSNNALLIEEERAEVTLKIIAFMGRRPNEFEVMSD